MSFWALSISDLVFCSLEVISFMHSDGLWVKLDLRIEISLLHSTHLIIWRGHETSKCYLSSGFENWREGSHLFGHWYLGMFNVQSPLLRWFINSSYLYTFDTFLSFCFRVTFFYGLQSWVKLSFFRIQFSIFLFTLFLPQYSWYFGQISDLDPTLDFWISSRQDRQNIFSHLSHS